MNYEHWQEFKKTALLNQISTGKIDLNISI